MGVDEMTQREQLLILFRENGGRITLGQIMQTTLAAEYRARISELRQEGFSIVCVKGKNPSDNTYSLTSPAQFDEVGQGLLPGVAA